MRVVAPANELQRKVGGIAPEWEISTTCLPDMAPETVSARPHYHPVQDTAMFKESSVDTGGVSTTHLAKRTGLQGNTPHCVPEKSRRHGGVNGTVCLGHTQGGVQLFFFATASSTESPAKAHARPKPEL